MVQPQETLRPPLRTPMELSDSVTGGTYAAGTGCLSGTDGLSPARVPESLGIPRLNWAVTQRAESHELVAREITE